MHPRNRRYFERKKSAAGDGSKKGSVTDAGYNEENQATRRGPKENPAPSAQAEYAESHTQRTEPDRSAATSKQEQGTAVSEPAATATSANDGQHTSENASTATKEQPVSKNKQLGESQDHPSEDASPNQDDTGGDNQSGERIDPH